jgi:hypothetical protein
MRQWTLMAGVLFALVGCMGVGGTAWAEEEKPTADLTVSALSQYIWRGQELSQDSVVIQPSMTVEYRGFGFNLWGNLDTDTYAEDTNNWNETDMTLYYGHDFGDFSLSGGYIYYALDAVDDSQEAYLSATVNTILSPTLTVYREFAHYVSWYVTLGISHSFELPHDMNLELGAQASYLKSDDEAAYPEIGSDGLPTDDKYDGWHDGIISAVLNIPFGEYVAVSPSLYWSFALTSDASDEMEWRSVDGNDDNFVYGGISVSMSF